MSAALDGPLDSWLPGEPPPLELPPTDVYEPKEKIRGAARVPWLAAKAAELKGRDPRIEVLHAALVRLNMAHCSPPLHEKEEVLPISRAAIAGTVQAPQPTPQVRGQRERDKQAPRLLELTWASDLPTDTEYGPQLVPGLFERKGVAMMFGASGTGKSTLMIDLACRVAAGIQWNGRAVLRGLVGIVAAESPEGTLRRVRAFMRHHHVEPAEMHLGVYERPLTFSLAAMDQLVASIKAHADAQGLPVRMVVIDTLAANEPGKEDSDHFGRVTCAATYLRDALDCLAAVVHHAGKIAEAGARGHTSLHASMDTVLEVSGAEGQRVAVIVKQRDGVGGEGIGFTLLPIGIGFRTVVDSPMPETVTACVVEYSGPVKRSKAAPRDGHQTRALDALRVDHRDHGTVRWTFKEAADVFRTHHQAVAADAEPLHRNTPRKTFEALAKAGHVLIDAGFISLQDT